MMRSLFLLAATAVAASAQSAVSCARLTAPTVSGATVVSVQAMQMNNTRVMSLTGGTMQLSFCDVNVTLTHGTSGDRVRVEVWMPLAGQWNGRFQGTGGGGFIAGTFGQAMAPAVMEGYAAASTDAGLGTTASFSGADTDFDQQLITNFASLSIHEMAVVGKAMVQQFYGTPARKSYFNGCSTGGRQGMMEAQKFPDDFHGIVAASPAINWDRFVTAELWPFSVMQTASAFPPACVLDAFTRGAVAACDGLDGAMDGVIASPGSCTFDPMSLVGRSIACNGTSMTLTASHANIFAQIQAGPRSPNGTQLWYGLLPGTSQSTLATASPFSLGATWVAKFVLGQNTTSNNSRSNGNTISAQSINTAVASKQAFATTFMKSQQMFGAVMGTDDPNLAAFHQAGGKLLSWHGLADQLIFPNGTLDYAQRVMNLMGPSTVDSFYRVFVAPGVMHCAGGAGAAPSDPLAALVSWVENSTAPDTLPAVRRANGTTISRNLCRYPQQMMYSGSGDVRAASSWMCMPGPAQRIIQETTTQTGTPVVPVTSAASGSFAESMSCFPWLMAVFVMLFLV